MWHGVGLLLTFFVPQAREQVLTTLTYIMPEHSCGLGKIANGAAVGKKLELGGCSVLFGTILQTSCRILPLTVSSQVPTGCHFLFC